MKSKTYEIQNGKELKKCKTSYIFKGLGCNLIPCYPNDGMLEKMENYIKEMLLNNGENVDNETIQRYINRSSIIGLNLSLQERKFIEALSIFIANSTLMNEIQKNKVFHNRNQDYKISPISYKNMKFLVSIKDLNKLYGRSITEKDNEGKCIVDRLCKKKFFLINHKKQIVYQKAFPMVIKGTQLNFSFHPFLIGRTYDKRTNFFNDIKTLYEAIFFEYLFMQTKSFRKMQINHLCFTTRSLLNVLNLKNLAKTHKQYVIKTLNTCFKKAFEKGIFTEEFEYTKDNFKKDDKNYINIPINPNFKWDNQ